MGLGRCGSSACSSRSSASSDPNPARPERLIGMTFNGGDLISIVNMAFWAVYCACLRLRPAMHTMSFLFAVAPISAAATLQFAVWEYVAGHPIIVDAETVGAMCYSALFTSIVAFAMEPWPRSHRCERILAHRPAFRCCLCHFLAGRAAHAFPRCGLRADPHPWRRLPRRAHARGSWEMAEPDARAWWSFRSCRSNQAGGEFDAQRFALEGLLQVVIGSGPQGAGDVAGSFAVAHKDGPPRNAQCNDRRWQPAAKFGKVALLSSGLRTRSGPRLEFVGSGHRPRAEQDVAPVPGDG